MHLEFCNYNKPYFDDLDKQRREIFDAIQAGFSGVCLPLYLLRDIREYISGIDMSFACPIDRDWETSLNGIKYFSSLFV